MKQFIHLIIVLNHPDIKSDMYQRLKRQVILTNVINSIDLNKKHKDYLLSFI